MIKVAFVIGEYPPAERRLREDAALAYQSDEVKVGMISVGASPYGRMSIPAIEGAAPLFHQAYIQAEKEGYDAAVPLGMLDLGVDGGRCLVDIPVVAPFPAVMHVASLLGDRFGFVNYETRDRARCLAAAGKCGMADRIVGTRAVEMPKSDMTNNRDRLIETFLRQARDLIDNHGAEVIIPGGVSQCPVHMKPDFLAGELGVPVVDGIGAPIRVAAMLVSLGYRHSRIRYPRA